LYQFQAVLVSVSSGSCISFKRFLYQFQAVLVSVSSGSRKGFFGCFQACPKGRPKLPKMNFPIYLDTIATSGVKIKGYKLAKALVLLGLRIFVLLIKWLFFFVFYVY